MEVNTGRSRVGTHPAASRALAELLFAADEITSRRSIVCELPSVKASLIDPR
jgi:hypothetical protein